MKNKSQFIGWQKIVAGNFQRGFPILLYTSTGNQYVGQWAQHPETGHEGFCIAEWGTEGDQAILGIEMVTHWQPLPPPP